MGSPSLTRKVRVGAGIQCRAVMTWACLRRAAPVGRCGESKSATCASAASIRGRGKECNHCGLAVAVGGESSRSVSRPLGLGRCEFCRRRFKRTVAWRVQIRVPAGRGAPTGWPRICFELGRIQPSSAARGARAKGRCRPTGRHEGWPVAGGPMSRILTRGSLGSVARV